jgi:hypothetical protein
MSSNRPSINLGDLPQRTYDADFDDAIGKKGGMEKATKFRHSRAGISTVACGGEAACCVASGARRTGIGKSVAGRE